MPQKYRNYLAEKLFICFVNLCFICALCSLCAWPFLIAGAVMENSNPYAEDKIGFATANAVFHAFFYFMALGFGLSILAECLSRLNTIAMQQDSPTFEPAQTNQADQGNPRRGEPTTITPVPPASGPSSR